MCQTHGYSINALSKEIILTECFSILQQRIQFGSNVGWFLDEVKKIFVDFIVGGEPDERVYFLERGGTCNLKIPERVSDKFDSMSSMLQGFKYRVIFENIWRSGSRPLLFHAGIVEKKGGAAIICGPRNTGKTTVVLEAVKLGYRYLSEEVAIFDGQRQSFVANPFHMATNDVPEELKLFCWPLDKRLFELADKERKFLWTPPIRVEEIPELVHPSVCIFLNRTDVSAGKIVQMDAKPGRAALSGYWYTRGNQVEHSRNTVAFEASAGDLRFFAVQAGTHEDLTRACLEVIDSHL